jgi:hypothetical protein
MRTPCLVTLPSLVALALVSCTSARVARPVPSAPQVVAVAGPTLGTYEFKPSVCVAGQHYVFYGADLEEEKTGAIVRLVFDPITGPVVRLFRHSAPFGASVVAARADCRTFKTEISPTGAWINGIVVVRVAFDLDCATKAGDFVVGKLSADECR